MDTTNLWHVDAFRVLDAHPFGRAAKALGGVRLEYQGQAIVVKDPYHGHEMGRGLTVGQALDAAWEFITTTPR